MAQGTLWMQPIAHIFSATGVNVAGAKAYFYLAGSSTPVAVYTDVGLITPHAVPVVADGNGVFAEIFLTPGVAYKVDLQTSAGVSLPGYPADNQLAIPVSASQVAFSGTAGAALSAGKVVYLSDGSGALNSGQWYLADSAQGYSSTIPVVGMTPAAISSGVSGTIQINGQVTGLSGLTAGTAYFVGTSGALTASAPTNARFIGIADSATSLILFPNPFQLTPSFTIPIVRTSVNLTGGIISFPAVQVPSAGANDLDDYEEVIGTPFVPVIGGSGGTSGQTYAVQVGLAVKVGRVVHYSGRVQLSVLGTITGNVQLQGLPYAAAATTNYRFAGLLGEWNSFGTNYVNLTLDGIASATALTLYGLTTATSGNAVLAQANLTANTAFTFSGTYVASA